MAQSNVSEVYVPNLETASTKIPRLFNVIEKGIQHNFFEGFKDKRELYLYLIAKADLNRSDFGQEISNTIEITSRVSGNEFAEEGFIFSRKKYIVEKDIPKIYEVMLANGYQQDFVKNGTKSNDIKNGLFYHSLFIKYNEHFMPVSALTIRENIDKKTGYSYYISYLGDVQEGVNIEKELNKYVKDRKYLPTFRMVKSIYNYGDGPQVSYRDQTLEGDAELALQSFYPWLTTSIEDFAKEYIASSSPVMLFFGPTGTGKTTFIRTMAQRLNAVIVATADTKVATNPELFEAYKDIIEVARKTGDKRPIILLIEDVDSLLMSRISGNREMSKLLNDTKGISPNKDIKIIFTSNLTNPGVIDEALTRPGRCFAQINFDKLTVEQGNKVREDLKLDKIDLAKFSEDGKVSLAEAIEEHKIKEHVNDGVFITKAPRVKYEQESEDVFGDD